MKITARAVAAAAAATLVLGACGSSGHAIRLLSARPSARTPAQVHTMAARASGAVPATYVVPMSSTGPAPDVNSRWWDTP